MSYSDILRANADMFEKTKVMLELDPLEKMLNLEEVSIIKKSTMKYLMNLF